MNSVTKEEIIRNLEDAIELITLSNNHWDDDDHLMFESIKDLLDRLKSEEE